MSSLVSVSLFVGFLGMLLGLLYSGSGPLAIVGAIVFGCSVIAAAILTAK